ncbi:NAD-dependent protein deacetylase sirtuin-1 [Allomyces javanicus]|nr:NAD-dependent protein deacetylase sirtuin-1 [Allomyces javanicus]
MSHPVTSTADVGPTTSLPTSTSPKVTTLVNGKRTTSGTNAATAGPISSDNDDDDADDHEDDLPDVLASSQPTSNAQSNGPVTLTDDERDTIRREARAMGGDAFTAACVFGKRHDLRKVILAFRDQFSKRDWADVETEILPNGELPQLYACVHIAVQRFIRRRQRLPNVSTLGHAVELLQQSSKILVVTGAGISVSCGIPDFRSKNGIYSRLTDYELEDPTQMFDLEYFRHKPETFYSFANEIYPSNFKPSPCHAFVALLEQQGKLLRNYTQNIDNIEELAGIERVIQCHGSFRTARCVTCGYKVPGNAIEKEVFAKTVPKCPKCPPDSPFPVIKPDIVFFGEQLPDEFHDQIKPDLAATDLILVIGSSLKVAPVSEILSSVPDHVPQLIINRELLPYLAHHFDVHLLGNADTVVMELCRRAGWTLPHPVAQEAGARKPAEVEFHEPNIYLFEGGILASQWSDAESDAESGDDEESDEDEDRAPRLVADGKDTAEAAPPPIPARLPMPVSARTIVQSGASSSTSATARAHDSDEDDVSSGDDHDDDYDAHADGEGISMDELAWLTADAADADMNVSPPGKRASPGDGYGRGMRSASKRARRE